jgi:preprotein translocase subunit SecG
MGFVIGLLTVVLVLNCLFLILLVLIQLPKKEAGAGLAFGAGATDALFGAGSGNVLTKVTKYSAGLFIGLTMLLSVLNINHHARKHGTDAVRKELEKAALQPGAAPQAVTPPPAPAARDASQAPITAPAVTNLNITLPTNPAAVPPPAPASPK